jgi:non-ribosomal peptide synthetase component F
MIQYKPTALDLPWDDAADLPSSQTSDIWILETKRKIYEVLHYPPWRIRYEQDGGHANLHLLMLHALFDAQSLRTVFNDVSAFYHQSREPILTPLEPVIDTILTLSSPKHAESTNFWQSLGTNAKPTKIPNLAPLRHDVESPGIHSRASTALLSELEAGCRSSNITLQAAGLASWLSILSAYTGEPLVTCGLVLSGRNFEAAQSAVFPCITTVPFTSCVVDDKAKVLKDVMDLTTNILPHQFIPLKEIQKLMGYPNEPLFDSIFAFQKIPLEEETQDLWTILQEDATIEYPISIELEPKSGRLEYRLTYLPHFMPKQQAVLILDQLDQLMNHFVFPENLSEIAAAENPTLFSISPPKEANLPAEASLVHELVELSALRYPNRVALDFATSISQNTYTSNSWTYAELDVEGNRIAHLLLSHDVVPGNIIGICFDKCPQASFATLGILKAGCSFVALDPAAPAARRAFIVEDSACKLVLSMKVHSKDLSKSLEAMTLNLDDVDLDATATERPALSHPISPQDCSYCLYTSGTTGTPKGCMITHENTVQALLAFQRIFTGRWNDKSRWLQFASFHFDVSVLEQYWSWSIGICVVSAPRDLIFEDIARTIRVLSITHLDLTPSLARILHPDDVPSLWEGVFITGGESLKQEILDVWGPKRAIYNFYGPTEATIGCTVYPRVPPNGRPSNIGYQFDNVGTFVLKPNTDYPVL